MAYLIDKLPELHPEGDEALLKAAEIIRTRGWCQNSLEDEEGRVCIIEALSRASADFTSVRLFLFGSTRCDEVHSLVNWNNTPGRTKEQVLYVLTSAARAKG